MRTGRTPGRRRREDPEITRRRIYCFMKQYIEENGYAPSVREISLGVHIKSTSTVHANLKSMHELGMISYQQGKRRAITLLLEEEELMSRRFSPEQEHTERDSEPGECDVPLVGTIAAGRPIFACEDIETYYTLPSDFLSAYHREYRNFLLRIKGDSMIDAAILDGDLVLVESRDYASDGDIVVALLDDYATVKRLSLKNGERWLLAENEAYEPIPFMSEDCRILGVVKAVFRLNL